MARRILVPVDDSEQSSNALEYALEEYPDDQLVALHVINVGNLPKHGDEGLFNRDELDRDLKEEQRGPDDIDVLEAARRTAGDHGQELEYDVERGDVADTIVSYIDMADIDHVVMGSHGRSGTSRILFGSVAETVTRRSPVPVTIVR